MLQTMIRYHKTMFGFKRISSSEGTTEMNIFLLYDLDTDLPILLCGCNSNVLCLQTVNKYSWQQNNLICGLCWVHHLMKFGYKRLNSSDDAIQTNIQQRFEPSLWPWTQQSNLSTRYCGLWCLSLHCDLDLEHSNLSTKHCGLSWHTNEQSGTVAYEDAPLNKVVA